MIEEVKQLTAEAAKASAWNAVWTFPSIIGAALVIAWGAESAQFLISQGFALTMLALIQTLPEFAVEGVIAWRAGQMPTPENIGLATANFTGALRLLIGLGWPLIYFVAAIFNINKKKRRRNFDSIKLDREHSVELMGLLVPTLYMFVIVIKASLTIYDSIILLAIYLVYISILLRLPPHEEEKISDIEPIPRFILTRSRLWRNLLITGCFLGGATAIYLIANPFLESMLGLSVVAGVPTFVFVQWVAPFLSEFPEKVSAFYWAKSVDKASMALMNMVSSGIAELTLLVSLIPIVYSISRGGVYGIDFDWSHRVEILMTTLQSLLGFLLLANMSFRAYEALGLFLLWVVQFIQPSIREEILLVYSAWIILELVLAFTKKRRLLAFWEFKRIFNKHIRRPKPS